jgi:hypothetical protein
MTLSGGVPSPRDEVDIGVVVEGKTLSTEDIHAKSC